MSTPWNSLCRSPSGTARALFATLVVAIVMTPACDSKAQPELRSALDLPEGAPQAALEQAAVRLTGVLEGVRPAEAIEYDVRDLGAALYIIRASEPGSYPGTGVASMVVDGDGVSYGTHGDRDLSDLVRSRGWLTAPPASAELLLRLLDAAYFEGIGSTSLIAPGLEVGEGRLTLHFEQFTPPGPSFPWRSVFAVVGDTQLYTVDNTLEGTGQTPRQVR